jgi:hypothetical protein
VREGDFAKLRGSRSPGRAAINGRRAARSEVLRRTACRKVVFDKGACGMLRRGREADWRRYARGKNDRCPIRVCGGANGGGAAEDAARAVVSWRSAARRVTKAIVRASDAARGGQSGRGCRARENSLEQKRIDCEDAECGTLCNRALPETPHPQSSWRLRSQSREAVCIGRSERI